MATKKNIQESIPIPTSLTEAQKEEVGKRIVDEIRDRTGRGIDKNGRSFPKYSKEYDKSGTPDLHLTGDMLADLDVLTITGSSVVVGYDVGHPDAGQVEGNTIGSYGQPSANPKKARDFIGLPKKVLKIIIEEVRNDPNFQETTASTGALIDRILGRFSGS